MVQLSSRGLRNAPVKNTRAMCTTIDPDEDVAGPVVHLAHEQPGAHREGEVHARRVGLGDALAVEG